MWSNGSGMNSDRPLHDLVIRARDALGADRCTLYALDPERRELVSRVALGMEEVEIRVPVRRGIVGYVARTGHSLMLRDVYNDPRFDRSLDEKTGYRTKSVLAMAIVGEGRRVLGVIEAINKATGTFGREDEAALAEFCQEAATLLR
jgi:adenylate cyclase